MSASASIEESTFNEFKALNEDLNQDDETLLRFLQAREMNIKEAETMLRSSLIWREKNNVESYLHWIEPIELENECQYKFTGLDYEGCPVLWAPIGQWNIRELIEKGLKDELVKGSYKLLERIMDEIRKSNSKQFVIIIGEEGQTYWKSFHYETGSFWYTAFSDFEKNYPEILKAAYVLNVPWVFPLVFNFIKPILSGHTVSKVKIFNSDKSAYLPALQECMPQSCIPSEYLEP